MGKGDCKQIEVRVGSEVIFNRHRQGIRQPVARAGCFENNLRLTCRDSHVVSLPGPWHLCYAYAPRFHYGIDHK